MIQDDEAISFVQNGAGDTVTIIVVVIVIIVIIVYMQLC